MIDDLFSTRGMVAVITGGGSGLGLFAARALDATGAKAVYILGRREETLRQAAKSAVHGTIKYIVADVTDGSSLKAAAQRIRKEEGFINLLFANAGAVGPLHSDVLGAEISIAEMQDKLLHQSMDDFTSPAMVNNTAVFYTIITFLDLLDAGNRRGNLAQDSQVIVTSSVAGFSRQMAFSFAYSTSKAAVNHLVKMLSTFFAQHGLHIRANLIAPGMYPTEMTAPILKALPLFGSSDDAFKGAVMLSKDSTPAERSGSEAEFAGTFLFLASKAGAYMNGDALISDGGRLTMLPATY